MVEGKDDTANLRRFYEVDTYETRGSAINEDDLERINKLNDLRGVIVLLIQTIMVNVSVKSSWKLFRQQSMLS